MKEYDPTLIAIIFAGITVEGFADGEFVTVEHDSDAFSDVVGTDGGVSRARSSDERGTITVKLMQTSPTNAAFSAMMQADLDAPGGAGVAPVVVTDLLNEATKHSAMEAWILRPTEASYDRTVGSREWKIRCANLKSFVAGN